MNELLVTLRTDNVGDTQHILIQHPHLDPNNGYTFRIVIDSRARDYTFFETAVKLRAVKILKWLVTAPGLYDPLATSGRVSLLADILEEAAQDIALFHETISAIFDFPDVDEISVSRAIIVHGHYDILCKMILRRGPKICRYLDQELLDTWCKSITTAKGSKCYALYSRCLVDFAGAYNQIAAHWFAIAVAASDDYVIGESPWLRILTRLPMEIQMVVCRRIVGLGDEIIASEDIEGALQWLFDGC